MTEHPPFDLDAAVRTWRRAYELDPSFAPDDVRELEEHLRDHVTARTAEGVPPADAFAEALQEVGGYGVAEAEYRKVYWRKARRGGLRAALRVRLDIVASYVRVAARDLRRHPGLAAINLVGLAAGVACCLLLVLFVRNEFAVGDVIPAADRLYRVESEWREPSMGIPITTLAPVAETMAEAYPEVIGGTRLYLMSNAVRVGAVVTRREVIMADSGFFRLLELPLLHGTGATALAAPRSVVVTDSFAVGAFGRTDVVGETVELETFQNGWQTFTVTGVRPTMPYNAVFNFGNRGEGPPEHYELIIGPRPFGDYFGESGWTAWQSRYLIAFVKLARGASAEAVQAKLDGFVAQYAPPEFHDNLALRLNPLATLHLNEQGGAGWRLLGLLAGVGFLVLGLAAVNFANLSTARALGRAREVGVRKAVGAHRGQLVAQFLGEAVLLCSLATAIGAVAAGFLFRPLLEAAGRPLVLASPWDLPTLLALVVVVLAAGGLAGFYPAWVLSGFQPSRVLKGAPRVGPGGGRLRQGLVVLQFGAAAVLLVAVYTVTRQLDFVAARDLGVAHEGVVVIESVPRDWSAAGRARAKRVAEQMKTVPGVRAASIGWDTPGAGDNPGGSRAMRPEGRADAEATSIATLVVDDAFLETFGLTLRAGRYFDDARPADSAGVVVNETAVRAFGWTPDEAVGRTVATWGSARASGPPFERTIIGVLEDYHFQSLRQPIRPLALMSYEAEGIFRQLSLRLAAGDVAETVARVEAAWRAALPEAPFVYTFYGDEVAAAYRTERVVRAVTGAAAALALGIACLGLLGLAALAVAARRKEVGVRKVLGASVGRIVVLLAGDFARPVVVALALALPLGAVLMRRWLDGFAYRTAFPWEAVAVGGAAALLLALVTVSVHTLRAATANPVESLRDE